MIQTEFHNFIAINQLCQLNERVLLGISGGIDSICMFHLFRQLNIPIGIAHCNFQLRGEESDEDEKFVQALANKYDIPFFNIRFNTAEVAKKEGISIQMAARDLRYDWFEETRNKYAYNYIAIAHNMDDVVETFLINLSRGSGIKGLTGIKPKSGYIIRPLIFSSRKEIKEYLDENDFDFREDSSNASVKYSRNLIRHKIIPLFEQLNPSFRETIAENISRLKDVEIIYNEHINNEIVSSIRYENERSYILIKKLKELNPVHTFLYEFLKPYGFSETQVLNIVESFDHTPGKQFLSPTHRLIKDREELIVEEKSSLNSGYHYIDANTENIEKPLNLSFIQLERTNNFKLFKSNKLGYFDLNKLEFPLILRKWKKGDYFMPLGMKNLKKLSDFFIDNKFSLSDKEDIWILESGNKIAWIVGHRIDERFKITDHTEKILKIEIIEK